MQFHFLNVVFDSLQNDLGLWVSGIFSFLRTGIFRNEDTDIILGGDVCRCVFFGTLVGMSVLMWFRFVDDIGDQILYEIITAWVSVLRVQTSVFNVTEWGDAASLWYVKTTQMCLLGWILTICCSLLYVLMLFGMFKSVNVVLCSLARATQMSVLFFVILQSCTFHYYSHMFS